MITCTALLIVFLWINFFALPAETLNYFTILKTFNDILYTRRPPLQRIRWKTYCKKMIYKQWHMKTENTIYKTHYLRFFMELRSSVQSKVNCFSFEIFHDRKPNTIWKKIASSKPSIGILDKGKSVLWW